jgi:hypothetical protein
VIDRERDREIDKIDTESNEIEMMNIGLLFTRKGGKRKNVKKKNETNYRARRQSPRP